MFLGKKLYASSSRPYSTESTCNRSGECSFRRLTARNSQSDVLQMLAELVINTPQGKACPLPLLTLFVGMRDKVNNPNVDGNHTSN